MLKPKFSIQLYPISDKVTAPVLNCSLSLSLRFHYDQKERYRLKQRLLMNHVGFKVQLVPKPFE